MEVKKIKRSITTFLIIIFSFLLFPLHSEANNVYQNEVYDFSFKIDEGWKLKTEEDLKNLSPNEKKEIIESLRNIEKDSHLFIRIKKENSIEYKNYKKLLKSYSSASDTEKKRLRNPISTLYGFSLDNVIISDKKIILSLSSNNSSGKILKEILWIPIDDKEMIEVEHLHTSKSFFTTKKDSVIELTFNSFKFGGDEKGSVDVITGKEQSDLEKKATELVEEFNIADFISNLIDSVDLKISIIFFVFCFLISILFFLKP